MEPYRRQQFDLLLSLGVERFTERLEQRNGGAEVALERLRTAPEGEGVWLSEFIKVLFADFVLDNPAGSCFVLEALAKRRTAPPASGTLEEMLARLARQAFGELLAAKSEEALEQRSGYQAVDTGDHK